MKTALLCLLLLLGSSARAAVLTQDEVIRNLISNLVYGIALLQTNVIHYKGITNAWLGSGRASMSFSNSAEPFILSTTYRTITNYTRQQLSRNVLADFTQGTITITNAGSYLLSFGYSASLGNKDRTVITEIFVNNHGTGLRMQTGPEVDLFFTGRIMGLYACNVGDVVSVRVKCDSLTPTLTVADGSLTVIRQDD